MLTTGHVDHFRTFGFTVLRGYLADCVCALRAEADAAIRDAYAAGYGIGVPGVKFTAYFGQLTAGTGALRLVPGSHHPEPNARLAACSRRQGPARGEAEAADCQARFPGFIADTSPDDVIAFDLHTWHASFDGGTG
jgi:hypothetical protein